MPGADQRHDAVFDSTIRRLDGLIRATHGSDRQLKQLWPQLRSIKASLDSGKRVTAAGPGRGIPLRIVVQTLKSSWHVDETWPIDGDAAAAKTTTGPGSTAPDPGPPIRPDPDPDAIAVAYEKRGVAVDPVLPIDDDW